MPPKCPQCGRFLSNAFARGLLTGPADCPRCDATLTAEQVLGSEALAQATASPATSVRPPDLPPEVVRPAEEPDVLEGWDGRAAESADLEARRGLPEPVLAGRLRAVGTIVVVAMIGGLLGALVLRRRRLGALAGTPAGG